MGELSEDGLLAEIFPHLPAGGSTLLGPGDDAAVVAAPDARVVVSTDVLVEGLHFRRDWSGGADVGGRAAAQNLADIAAMGARPTALVVGLVAPRELPVRWVRDLAVGLGQACEPHDVGVVGGDLSGGSEVVVAVTVLGSLDGARPVTRDGARPGDVVAHAGVAGQSAAGYALLVAASGAGDSPTSTAERSSAAGSNSSAASVSVSGVPSDLVRLLVRAHRRPDPPISAGVAASRAGATAMLDVSDGLLRDASRVARASGVVVDLLDARESFPDDVALLDPVGRRLGVDVTRWVLTGGEDHGLLATFPRGTAVPAPFRVIGEVRAPTDRCGPGTVLIAGRPLPDLPLGWDHFAR